MPNYIVSMSPTHTVLRNYEGLMVNYPEPEIKTLPKPQDEQTQSLKAGVWELASGKMSIIQPVNMIRNERRQKIVEKRQKAPTSDGGFLFDL
jgi:lysine 2,3-aminomutase